MNSIKISKDCFLPVEHIKFYLAYESYPSKTMVRNMRKEGKVFDFTFGKKISTVIYLVSGELVLSPVSVETIHNRIELLSKNGISDI